MLVIYIADGCGVATTGGENITVEDAGGNEQTLQCTLAPFLKCLTFGISQEPNSSCAKDFSRFALTWFYKPFFNVWSCVVFLKQALSCEGSNICSRYLYLLHSLAFS